MMRRARHVAAFVLLVAMIAGSSAPRAATGEPPRVPVVLVHDVGTDPDASWGLNGNAARSMTGALLGEGYVPGETLFFLDHSGEPDPDYAAFASELADLVGSACSVSNSGQADVIAAGAGSLITRLYIASDGYRGDIRNLIMIAPPNRGSHLSTFMRLVSEVIRQEQRRFSGGRLTAPLEAGDPYEYVAARADLYYEPLYGEYLWDNEISVPSDSRPAQSFEEWFVSNRPGDYNAFVVSQQHPVGDSSAEGRCITKAYCEVMALNAGRNNYVTASRRRFDAEDALGDQPFVPFLQALPRQLDGAKASLWEMIASALKEIAVRIAVRLGLMLARRWSSEALGVLKPIALNIAEDRTKLPWTGLAVSRTLDERIEFAQRSDQELTANCFLERLNREEELARAGTFQAPSARALPRYVTIAERLRPPIQSYLWSGTTEGTPSLELRCALAPLGRDDALHVAETWFVGQPFVDFALARKRGLFSNALETKASTVKTVIRELRDPWEDSPPRSFGTMPCSLWEASYSTLQQGRRAEGFQEAVYVEAACPAQRNGVDTRPAAWLTCFPSDEGDPFVLEVPLSLRDDVWKGKLPIPAGMASVHLGTRLVSERLASRLPAHLVTGALNVPPSKLRYSVQADPVPETPDGPAQSEPALPPEIPSPDEGESPARPPIDVPSILITRRDKMTTTKKENRAAHARWEWEFGDGQVSSDDGMPSLSKPHRYDEPGRYRATARSVDAEGTVLGTYRWDVNVEEPGGKEVLFEVAALSEPEVSLGIEGPKEWIVGRPARFEVDIELACEEGHEIGEMYYSPAKSFEVQWERPGRYEVRAAVTFRVKAAPPNGSFNAWVTRVAVKEVNVLATSSSG